MRALIPLLLLCQVGISHAALFADNEAREELIKLRKFVKEEQEPRIAELKAKLAESEKARQALEARLAEIETREKSSAVDLLTQIDRLNAELSNLRGQLEVNSHQLQLTQQRQRDLYADLDSRLRKLESGALSAPSPSPETPGMTTASNADAELKSYEAAHELFKAGKYPEASQAFNQLLQTYPNGKYAPNAYYWMGYAQFSNKDYKAAIASQQKLIQQFPDNSKVPDAMYNIANSQIQLSDVEAAKKTLRSLLDKHPASDAAPLAKKRLSVLESIKTR